MFLITDVVDPDFMSSCGNLFEEPISVGQYVLADSSHAMPVCEEADTPHSKVRTIEADKYLKAANKQQKNFNAEWISTMSYRPGHTRQFLVLCAGTHSTKNGRS